MVLYEMLTGTRLFEGATISATLASVLKTEPDWTALPAQTPAAICRLLRRCLEKDRKHRLSDAADARLEIDDALSGAASESVAAPAAAIVRPSMWRRVLPIAAAAVFGGLVGGGGVWALLQPRPPAVQRVTVTPTGEVGDSSRAPDVTISPNGRHIVYALGQSFEGAQLFVRSLDQLEATPLRSGFAPFVSPDSAWIGYADRNGLRKVRITGGPPVTICTTPEMGSTVNGASWGSNDTIVFGTVGGGLFRVAAGGGTPEALTRPDTSKGEAGHVLPEVLPGGRAVLFTIVPSDDLGERNQIAVLNLETRQTKILIHEGSTPRYASSGHLVYAAEGSLRAVPFDVGRLEVRGNPVPVAEHIATKRASAGAAASFGLAQDGTLIYRTGDVQSGANRVLVWVDRQGHEEPIGAPVRTYFYPRLSPDGARIALDIRDQGMDIWVWEFARHSLTQLTFDPGLNREGVWNPDGKRIAFSAQRDGFENLYWEAADGTGTAERLTDRPKTQLPLSFTPDGMRLLFVESANSNPPYDIGVVNLTGDRRAELLLHGPQSESNAEVSPDGRWLAYQSDESKQDEVYVRPFPNVDSGRWLVSTGGGTRPAWGRNGRELFYYQDPGKILAVTVQPGPTFVPGTPQVVVDGAYVVSQYGRTYDVSLDGKRFLMIKDAPRRPSQLIVVQNFFEELKRLAPTK